MSKNHFVASLALALSFSLLTPAAFFLAPQRTHAQIGVPTLEANPMVVVPTGTTALKTTISAILDALTQVNTFLTAVAGYANTINTYVLQPLAFVLSGNLMKMLTSSVINYVIGKANGTGIPQFIVDVRKSMQTVADSQALAYLKQVNLTGSPFSSSIASALRTNYLQGSSLAGMWAANMCTLSRTSQNVPAYLAGNWSQGGVAAWFALTTQTQNNPYMLYQTSQAGLANVIGVGVGGVTGARTQTLSWGQGFMSWCSTNDAATQTQNAATTAYQACMANGGTGSACQAAFEGSGGLMTAGAINPGDPCTKSDGTSGTIQTPGSVIKSTLDKVLGGQQDQIVRMGNIGPQINQMLGSIATVVQTVKFAQSLLGGGATGGLLNAGQPGGSLSTFSPSRDANGNFTGGYMGATNSSITAEAAAAAATANANASTASTNATNAGTQEAAASSVSSLGMTARAQLYQTSWSTIGSAASAAKANVLSLIDFCAINPTASQSSVTIIAANAALTNLIQPVLTQATSAPAIAAAAIAMDAKVKSEVDVATSTYAADLETLKTMSPTIAETASAQQNALSFGTPVASPVGSLNVLVSSTVSIVSRMNLINTNATALKASACTPPPDYTGAGGA